jgi:exopolyphosphatase/guanosine-5'-triphosphate,3'-diphosphate pyrophosphatase
VLAIGLAQVTDLDGCGRHTLDDGSLRLIAIRCACIDIGSNTTRLLVAERGSSGLREVGVERAFTSLGAGRRPADPVGAPKIEEVAHTVARQVAVARAAGASHVFAVGTAAVRTAPNAQELLDAVHAAAGIEVRVLSGAEEAEYAFRGATSTLVGSDVVAVADVGGGSTELVLGTPDGGPTWSVSLPIGSARLRAGSDPPTAPEVHAWRAAAAREFAAVTLPQTPLLALAAGGSANSVHRLVGPELTTLALCSALDVLCGGSAAEVAARTGLDPRRVALLPAGLVLLEAVGRKFGAPLWTAIGGLREGILLAELTRLER